MRAPRFIHQHKFDLIADAVLISSGLFAFAMSVTLTLVWLLGGFDSSPGGADRISDTPLAAALSLLALFVGAVVGPALAWRLHGRHLRTRLLLALVGALLVLGAAAGIAPLLAQVFAWLLSPFTESEFAGALVVLALAALVYIIVLVHAARDAMAPAGDPPLLERLRLLSLTALLLLVFVVAGALAISDNGEISEALIFTMVMGFGAAATTGVAVYIDREHAALSDN